MRLVIINLIQLCLRTLVFSIVLRHSNYNNRIISIEGIFLGLYANYSIASIYTSGSHFVVNFWQRKIVKI